MTKISGQDSKQQKTTTLIESEGRILRLEVDPEAPGESTAASLRIFVEATSMSLGASDVARVRRALRRNSPTKGRA
jgi:hypothetical protein